MNLQPLQPLRVSMAVANKYAIAHGRIENYLDSVQRNFRLFINRENRLFMGKARPMKALVEQVLLDKEPSLLRTRKLPPRSWELPQLIPA